MYLVTAGLTIFILILFAGLFLNLFGLPGTVVIFCDVLLYAVFTGFDPLGWKIILFLLLLTILAEGIDFFLVMRGFEPSASRKSVITTVSGAVAGAFLLTPFLWGPGMWLGFFLGGLGGILTAELVRQSKLKISFRTSGSEILSMVGRKIIKGFISLVIIAFSLSNIYS